VLYRITPEMLALLNESSKIFCALDALDRPE
jgi:hypothetical protein